MQELIQTIIIPVAYLLSAVLFIMGLKQLSHPKTAPRGNQTAALGMLIAIVATLIYKDVIDYTLIIAGIIIGGAIGAYVAKKVEMTAMPQMVAIFNGFGGGASVLVAVAEFFRLSTLGISIAGFTVSTIGISVIIGGITFTGSIVAFAKLQGIMRGAPILFKGQQVINSILLIATFVLVVVAVMTLENAAPYVLGIIGVALVLGYMFVIPIGGADMPVVISLLNSFSGIAAAATGFVLSNNSLIISGSLVGASGIILTNIMCKGMNRTIWHVLFAGFGGEDYAPGEGAQVAAKPVKSYEAEDTVVIFENAQQVVVVPGYGMAVAQAQHAVHELEKVLEAKNVKVKYAVHPVAGRMPGHMNVLLAEANVPYDNLYDLDQINPEFEETDVALVIGANDVVNPAARHDTASPIFGMPILDVDRAGTVFVLKRSMNPGFAGIENELFFNDNTIMLFGDAKDTVSKLVAELK